MKISYIIPAYNVEKYLRQCVESLSCQTYRDTEIILVDDGSPDGCPALCDQLAAEDERIRVVHKENGGSSDARNAGLKVATGDYVIFVDSDDFWVGEDSLQKLVDAAEKNPECDFIGYNCSYYYTGTDKFRRWIVVPKSLTEPVTGDKALQTLVATGTFPMSACLKMIKRCVLSDGGITFKKGQTAEDIPWFINLLEMTRSCIFVNEYIYAYRQNVEGSITNSGGERSFYNLLDIVNTELVKIDERNFTEEAKDALRSFLAYEVCILMAGVHGLPEGKRPSVRKELESLCWLLRYDLNPKVRKAQIVYSLFGFSTTAWVLRMYLRHRSDKIWRIL